MRTIVMVMIVVVFSACRSAPVAQDPGPAASAAATGAPTSRAAVDAFFAAMKSGDLQAAGAVWGSKSGAARDFMQRDQLEIRLLTLQCWLAHDTMRIIGAARIKADTAFYRVELARAGRAQETDVVTVTGPRSRWYVADPKIVGLQTPGCR